MGLHGVHNKINCCTCECKPKTLATFTTGGGTWDLSPYQGDGIGPPGGYWRLTNNYMSYVPQQQGCINDNGKLVGLPNSISTTTYKYTWTFVLDIGCLSADGKQIIWPNNSKTTVFKC